MKIVLPKTIPVQQFRRFSNQVKVIAPIARKSCIITWPGWINFVIWTIGFFVMLALVIKNFFPMLDDYQNHNTATVLDIQNDPIPPDVTICIPWFGTAFHSVLNAIEKMGPEYFNGTKSMDGVCDICVLLEANGYDFWNYITLRTVSDELYVQVAPFVVNKLRADNFSPIINQTNRVWVQFIVDTLRDFFIRITYIDKFNMLEGSSIYNIFALNISNEDLDRLNRYFLKSVELSITGGCVLKEKSNTIPNSTTRYPLKLDLVMHSWQKLCFQLPFMDFRTKEFQCTYSSWPNRWNRFPESIYKIYHDPTPMYTNMERTSFNVERQDSLYASDSEIFKSKVVYEHITLRYAIDARLITEKPDQPKPCSDESSPDKCLIKKQYNETVNKCQCIPFTFRHYNLANLTLPYCAMGHYSKCLAEISDSLERYRDECNVLCNYTFYSWTIQKNINPYYDHPEFPQFMLQIGPSNKPYTEFSFKTQTTREQFLASVGGLINLYIGGSGLTLFAFMILFMEQTKRWLRLKKEPHEEQNNLIVGWQALRMASIFHMLGQKQQQQPNHSAGSNVQNTDLKNELQDLKEEMQDLKSQLQKAIEKMVNKPAIQKDGGQTAVIKVIATKRTRLQSI